MIPLEETIIQQMLSPTKYDIGQFPMPTGSTLLVNITLNSFRLLYMDQKEETIQFQNEFLMMWIDPNLGWDRENFSSYNADYVKVMLYKVWRPDIIYYNTINRYQLVPNELTNCDIREDGYIRISVPATITVPCSFNFDRFPYDHQVCEVFLSSWVFNQSHMMLTPTEGLYEGDPPAETDQLLDAISYTGNSEWRLSKIVAENVSTLFVGELKQAWTGNYSQIRYRIYLQRKPVYYIMVIQIPTFIIGTITLFGMFSPFSQRMERWHILDIGQNMLLAISYMLNLISNMMPKTEQLPLLGNYIIAEIFVCSIGMLVSIFILEIHARADQRNWRPPDWLCKIILFSCRRLKVKALAQPDPVRKRTAPITKIDDEVADMLKLDLVKGQLRQSLHLVRDFMERDDAEHEWKLIWVMIFDRIDFFCLILFQAVNIIVSGLFMH